MRNADIEKGDIKAVLKRTSVNPFIKRDVKLCPEFEEAVSIAFRIKLEITEVEHVNFVYYS